MKTALALKYMDIAVQLGALAASIAYTIVERAGIGMIMGYLLVGLAQYVSCLLNRLFLPLRYRSKFRKTYEVILAILTIVFVLLLVINREYISSLICVLMLGSPFLAIWYGRFTIEEIKYLSRLKLQK